MVLHSLPTSLLPTVPLLIIQIYTYHALCAMLGLSGGGEMGPEVSSSGDAVIICVNIRGFISILDFVLLGSSFEYTGETLTTAFTSF